MGVVGTVIASIIAVGVIIYGFVAMGEAYQGGGCLGVVAIAGLIVVLACFGL